MASHSFLDHHGPVPIAHRGGALEGVENTMAAFEHAVALGYEYVETDVHSTVDGHLVAFHDEDLTRVTGGRATGRIGESRWDQLRRVDVGGERIPLLAEVLSTWPDLRVTIDPKRDRAVAPLIAVLEQTDLDRVCVGSFSDRRIARFAERFGDRICLGLGPAAVRRLRLLLPMKTGPGRVVQVPPRYRGVPLVDRVIIRRAHRHGLAFHVWTINDRSAMETLLDRGVDGVMTDRPALLRKVFEERGLWPGQRGGAVATSDQGREPVDEGA